MIFNKAKPLLAFCLVLFFGMPLLAEDWAGTPCGISLSYDASIWTVLPENPGYDLALKAQGNFNDDPIAPYYQVVYIGCKQLGPGKTLSDAVLKEFRQDFKKSGGAIVEESQFELSGAPGYFLFGKQNKKGQPTFITRMLIQLKDQFVFLTAMTPTDSVFKADLSHPSFETLLGSIRFKGYTPTPPPEPLQLEDWGLSGKISLLPQQGWNLWKHESNYALFSTEDGKTTVILAYQPWEPTWQTTDSDLFDAAWLGQLLAGSYGSWEKKGSQDVGGKLLDWKGGFEYGHGTGMFEPQNAKTHRKTFYQKVGAGVLWIRIVENGGWQDPFSGQAIIKKFSWP